MIQSVYNLILPKFIENIGRRYKKKENVEEPLILPIELISKIFEYLDRQNLEKCSEVCKSWKLISSDDCYWRKFYQEFCQRNDFSSYKKHFLIQSNYKSEFSKLNYLVRLEKTYQFVVDYKTYEKSFLFGIFEDRKKMILYCHKHLWSHFKKKIEKIDDEGYGWTATALKAICLSGIFVNYSIIVVITVTKNIFRSSSM